MTHVSRTINPLHFEDLEPRRFEDLALALIFRLRAWEDIHHDGRTGGDDGVDIRAIEKLPDATLRYWAAQCKRYQKFSTADAKDAIKEAIKDGTIPDVLLLVIGCDVSLRARNSFETAASAAGIKTPVLWTSSKLQAMLYTEHQDLLFGFFGISLARQERGREGDLKRKLSLKRKLLKLFPRSERYPNIIIHSIDDEMYPEVDGDPIGRMSSWIKSEFAGHYHNGIELYLSVDEIIVNRADGKWAILGHPDVRKGETPADYAFNDSIYQKVKIFRIARIPFRNMVEVDDEGDEYYPFTHLYCWFADQGTPYEEIFCREVDGYAEFRDDNQFKYVDRVFS